MSRLEPVFTVQLTKEEIMILNIILGCTYPDTRLIKLGLNEPTLEHLQRVFEIKSELVALDLLEPYRYVEVED